MSSNDLGQWAKHVPAAYNRIAEAWRQDRLGAAKHGLREQPFLDRLTAPLLPGASVLDVGCGFCMHAEHFVRRGFQVAGLDASKRMLDLARVTVPEASLIHGDMRTADPGGPFDALVAWDSVFHLPRGDHELMFKRFGSWLRPGGRLLISLGGSGDEGFTSQMHGETFYYSGYEPVDALQLLTRAGFEVEHWEVDDPSSRGHIAVLAVKL